MPKETNVLAKQLVRGLIAVAATAASLSFAQPYPARPVHIVVPYAPGGGIDVLARVLAQKLSDMWGQGVVVDNRPGGGATLGSAMVAKAAPDGYTFLIASNTLALSASSRSRIPYNVQRDFTPVMLATRAPIVLGIHPSVSARNIKDLVTIASTQPGGMNFASAGQGTSQHLAIELLKKRTGILATHIPYKGSAPAMTDLLDGRVSALFATPAAIMPQVADRRLVALAVTSANRSAVAPGVPTMAEAGVAGFDMSVWFGFLAPAGTPQAAINKFFADSQKVLAMPDVVETLKAQGQEVSILSPGDFSAYLQKEIGDWSDIVRRVDLRFD